MDAIYDCHLHTEFSADSETPVRDQLEKAISLGMKEICITDHRKYFISPEMCASNPPFFPIPQFSSAAAIRFIYKAPCLFVYNLTTRRIITRSL